MSRSSCDTRWQILTILIHFIELNCAEFYFAFSTENNTGALSIRVPNKVLLCSEMLVGVGWEAYCDHRPCRVERCWFGWCLKGLEMSPIMGRRSPWVAT